MRSTSSSATEVDDDQPNAAQPDGECYDVLALQQGLLFHNRFEPGSGVDILQVVIDWPEPLDQVVMTAAWQAATRRHPALRTTFSWLAQDRATQRVHPEVTIPVHRYDWRDESTDGPPDRQARLDRFLAVDRSREFDPATAPLVRVGLIEHAADRHTIVFSLHHVILDGRSVHLLLTEVFNEYAAIVAGNTPVPVARRPFQDFAVWAGERPLAADQRFWRTRLSGVTVPTPLPLRPAADIPPREPDSVRELTRTLDPADSAALERTAQAVGVPLSTLVNAAWAVLLHRYSGEQDVVFGAVRSCRRGSIEQADTIIGMLINTVPLRIDVHPRRTVRDWLVEVRAQIDAVRSHQVAPLTAVQRWSELPPSEPLFESLLMYEHRDLQTALRGSVPDWNGRTARVLRHPGPPVTVCVFGEPVLRVLLYHDRRRCTDAAADAMLRHFTNLLVGLASGLDTPVAALPLFDPTEEHRLTREWAGHDRLADTATEATGTIGDRFAERVRERPDAVAVTGVDGTLTYAELDARANQLAHLLIRRGVTPDQQVAVALPRSVRLVLTLLAVVRAGAAYLPLDPANPPARTGDLLAAAGDPVVLTATGVGPAAIGGAPPLPDGARTIDLDRIDAELAGLPTTAPERPTRPESLAYVNYTSGSTGTPKGVGVPHRAVLRLVHEPGYLRLGPDQTVLHLASAAFDAATLELWGSLLNGGRLVVAPPDPLGPAEIARLLRAERISVLWLTAGLFHQVVEQDPGALAGVDQLLAGGDVLDPGAVRAALRVRAGRPLVNGYGPTENTTFTCCHPMTDPAAVPAPVPIGRPVPRSTVYVLDGLLRPVPVGVPGELYTGGDGLARGYLGEPGRTAERFLPDPFDPRPGARMYRTGDRVRWSPDGTLEFLGRIDRQVKIRGFRVEPAEAEAVLRAHPLVGEVAVVVHGDGERRRLVAYVSPGSVGTATLDEPQLDAYAVAHLPVYLRPAGYVLLPKLPLNRNGKVDRNALPAPTLTARPAPERPLTDPTQVLLAALWGDLLGAEVGRAEDDFFALGGNSLLATRLAFLAAERFGVDLPVRAVYDQHNLASLAAEIDRRRATPEPPPVRITARDRGAYRTGTATLTTPRPAPVNDPLPASTGDGQPAPVTEPVAETVPGPAHLVRPGAGPWAMWRWVGLRAAGFPVGPLTGLGDPEHVQQTDAVLAGEDRLAEVRRALADNLHRARRAAPTEQRSRWNRADRQVRQGVVPDELPPVADPALAALLAENRAALADAVDRVRTDRLAFARSHERASARRSAGLRAAAADPLLREAVTWQNRHALRTGLDPLLHRTGPVDGEPPAARDSKHRQHEALVATYLQRYCVKNDTIGFFGPVGWATVAPGGTGLRIEHGPKPLAARTVYFENWAMSGLADALTERDPRLAPWLIPRRLPFLSVLDDHLLLPLTPPAPLPPVTARLLAAADGTRTALEIAAELVADPSTGLTSPDEVYRLLAELRDAHRVTWSLEVPKEDLFPERAVRKRLDAVTDPAVREPALHALDDLVRARDAVAAAAGDADRLGAALAGLDTTFTELTGAAATRRAGRVYAGRTLVYEDCRAGDRVTLSTDLMGTLWPALSLLLESARWFTFAGTALFGRACRERYTELVGRTAQTTVPFADFWLWANDLLFDLPERLIAPVIRGLQDRWSRLLPDLDGQRRIQLDSASIADRVAAAFAAPRPGWIGAYQHSPDVMLVADGTEAIGRGDFQWVVGEVHPGVNTLRSALFMAQHPQPEELVAAMRADLPGARVVLAATGEEGGAPSRLTDKLITDRDLRLVFGHDSCGLDPRTAVAVADCVLESRDGTLTVRTRDGKYALPLTEVVGEALMLQLIQRFDLLPPADHRPRITVDRVVIARENWRFAAAGLDFARTADEAERFREVRRWQRDRGLPRYVFVKTPVEKKPFFLDFASLASVDGFARAVRRTVEGAGPDASLRLSEMLPTPEQLWLTDPTGGRRTAEFRLVAVDTRRPDATEPGPGA
ncbi:non-ribosomal peptide synthetase [Micromonospora sp. NBC_01796]|uniref:non-ribosomal peptide synthetase n=1 Tax=Micromonospora sp. NBC_01796 TaxID=2975987 RepID=UPI002DDBCD00|nr:non-ribosomal peptide synthetase [Micromonospora sp. NBC_01796]WSA83616.1 amino acid adenylation domain-containing protein [Micromonospora sp. NBC_01796]